MTYKVVSPNGVEIGGFATERDAVNKCRELNSARYGNPARHWSRRWVVQPEQSWEEYCAAGHDGDASCGADAPVDFYDPEAQADLDLHEFLHPNGYGL